MTRNGAAYKKEKGCAADAQITSPLPAPRTVVCAVVHRLSEHAGRRCSIQRGCHLCLSGGCRPLRRAVRHRLFYRQWHGAQFRRAGCTAARSHRPERHFVLLCLRIPLGKPPGWPLLHPADGKIHLRQHRRPYNGTAGSRQPTGRSTYCSASIERRHFLYCATARRRQMERNGCGAIGALRH